jgi:hypothetical protein
LLLALLLLIFFLFCCCCCCCCCYSLSCHVEMNHGQGNAFSALLLRMLKMMLNAYLRQEVQTPEPLAKCFGCKSHVWHAVTSPVCVSRTLLCSM